jgi:predicted nucleotidyltransferase
MSDLRRGLEKIYGPRLRGVYLFGSRARGDDGPDSDLDVLVVLDKVDHYMTELERTGALVSRVSLAAGVALSRVFVPESDWLSERTTFLENVREEAVPA